MLLFNESTVMVYLYLLIGVSDYNLSSNVIDPLGIGLLSIVMLAFIVNLLIFFCCLFRDLKRLWLRFKHCLNKKRATNKD